MSAGVCAPQMSSIIDSIAFVEAFSRCCLASRGICYFRVVVILHHLVHALRAEKQAWAMAAPNLFALRFTLASWGDKDGDLSAELCLRVVLVSHGICVVSSYWSHLSRPTCLVLLRSLFFGVILVP